MRIRIILITTLFLLVIILGCTPKISKVSFEYVFKEWNKVKKINEVDSSASMSIYFNRYKDLFEGRESFLSFKKNSYYINFNKIDTLYTEKDIKSFFESGYYIVHKSFIPKYCKVRIIPLTNKKLIIDFEIKDDSIPDILKGRFKLKLSREHPEYYDVFKDYKN
jgi:hypothetical protein